jgi:hypothetical protein
VSGVPTFANGAVSAAFVHMFGEAAASNRPSSREVAIPEDAKYGVEKTLEAKLGHAVNVDQIKVIENSKWANFVSGVKELISGGSYIVTATTQRDTIYLSSHITADQFFADPELLLHEYYHVVNQWNNGSMSNFSYIVNPTKWETPAYNFGSQNAGMYQFFRGDP